MTKEKFLYHFGVSMSILLITMLSVERAKLYNKGIIFAQEV